MKRILASIAVLLAIAINVSLLYDLCVADTRPIAKVETEPTEEVVVDETQPVEDDRLHTEENAKPRCESCGGPLCEHCGGCHNNGYYYNNYYPHGYWYYQPYQPVRNTVKFFHNRRPVRRTLAWVFCGRCW